MKDIFDRDIRLGDLVAYGMRYGDSGALGVYRVTNLDPPMALKIKYSGWWAGEEDTKPRKIEFIKNRVCIISERDIQNNKEN